MSALFFLPAFLVDCAAGVCAWGGGAVCTQVTCQSYDNESIPSCFGSYFREEKNLDFRHFNGTRIWGNGNIRNNPPSSILSLVILSSGETLLNTFTIVFKTMVRWMSLYPSVLAFFFSPSELADEIYSVVFTTSQALKRMKSELLAETSTCRLNC